MIANFVPPALPNKPSNLTITKKYAIINTAKNISTIETYNPTFKYVCQSLKLAMPNTTSYKVIIPSINENSTLLILILLKPYSASGINTLLSLFIMMDPPCIAMILCKSKNLLFLYFLLLYCINNSLYIRVLNAKVYRL